MSYSRSRSRDRRGGRDDIRENLRGTVIRINDRSGYGFLEVDGETEEVFFHSNDVVDDIDIRQLREGDAVTLDLHPSKKKPGRFDAKNVKPPEEAQDRHETGRRPSPRRRRSRSRGRRGYSRDRSRGRYSRRDRSYSRGRSRDRSYDRDRGRDRDRRGGRRNSNVPCLDFKRGDCRYGDRCKFSHESRSRRY